MQLKKNSIRWQYQNATIHHVKMHDVKMAPAFLKTALQELHAKFNI